MPSDFVSAFILALLGNAANVGSRSCSACPILLMDRRFGCFSAPSSANASSSKKKDTWLPLSRKYASLVRFWSFVLNTERGCFAVSKSSTSASARESMDATSSGLAKCSRTKPSVWNFRTCSG